MFRARTLSTIAPSQIGHSGSESAFQESGNREQTSPAAAESERINNMKRHALILAAILFAVSPAFSASAQQRRKQDTWYERALRQINPDDADYGSVLEQHKHGFISQLRNPYFRYS